MAECCVRELCCAPAATPEQISEIYQFYVTGTDQIYPSERLPIVRALSGERTRIDERHLC
ncbi:MAG: hypothetical protein ABI417_07835 [Coleofasciculaceae cyanobacterium]